MLPISKTDIVCEMSSRLEPIVVHLLQKINVLAEQILELQKSVKCKNRAVGSI